MRQRIKLKGDREGDCEKKREREGAKENNEKKQKTKCKRVKGKKSFVFRNIKRAKYNPSL